MSGANFEARDIYIGDLDRTFHAVLSPSGEKVFTIGGVNEYFSNLRVRKIDTTLMLQEGEEVDYDVEWTVKFDRHHKSNKVHGRVGIFENGSTETIFAATSQIIENVDNPNYYDAVEFVAFTMVDDDIDCTGICV